MTDQTLIYIFFGILAILLVFCFAIGTEKMIKLLLGNYLLMLFALAGHQSLVILSVFLQKTPTLEFMWLSYTSIANFLSNGKMSFVLIMYILLSILIYYKSKIRIVLPLDDIVQKILYIFLAPFTSVGIVLALLIAIFGISIFNPDTLVNLPTWFPQNQLFFDITSWMPLWVFLHALCTILLTSEVKIQIKTGV